MVEVYIVLCTSVDIDRVRLQNRSGHRFGSGLYSIMYSCGHWSGQAVKQIRSLAWWRFVTSTYVDIGSICKTDQATGLVEVCVQLCTSVDIGRVRL